MRPYGQTGTGPISQALNAYAANGSLGISHIPGLNLIEAPFQLLAFFGTFALANTPY